MALTDENGNGMVMPVQPMYGQGGGGFGNGFGGDWAWIILLLLLGWGNNGWGNNGGANGGQLYPWMNQAEITNDGFRDQMLQSTIMGIGNNVQGIATQLCNCCADIQQSLCNGFAGVNATVNAGFANAETAANARQMANMQQGFGMQTAMMQGFNALQAQQADCCCENRLGTADLKYTIATENCADRAAISDGIRDLLTNQTANTQRILDQLCQDKIDAKNDTISQLRQELLYARGQASQDVQTAAIRAGQATTANQLISELRSCPVPSMPVYGMTPIFTCNQNNGCGCGCGM